MKRVLLPVFALVLAAILVLVLWVARAPEDVAPAESQAVPSATLAALPVALAAGELENSAARAPEITLAERASAASEPRAESWDIDTAIWVSGTVRAPVDCADDEVEVIAIQDDVTLDEVLNVLGRPDDARAKAIFSRRRVEPDGTFRVPFPPETKTGYVVLVGRYQYVASAQAIDLAAGAREIVLEPDCGACLTGTVTAPQVDGAVPAELEGLRVQIGMSVQGWRGANPGTARMARRAVKLAGGAFEARALPSEGEYKVRIEPETLAALETAVSGLRAHETRTIALELVRGGVVRGVVRGPDGPIADADVEAATKGQWFGFDNAAVREAKSRADGTFELPAVMPGRVVVRAQAKGWLEGDGTPVEIADGAVQEGLVLELSSGESVAGTVTWADGTPAKEVEVDLEFDLSAMVGMGAFNALHGAKGQGKTDLEGRFRIGGLGKGPFTVKSKSLPPGVVIPDDEQRKKALHHARVDGVAPGTATVVLVLREPQGLPGRALDETGAPVTAFTLHATRVGQGMFAALGQDKLQGTFEDAEGRFLLAGLLEGNWKVYALAKGFAASAEVEVAIPRPTSEPELVIPMTHAATVAGVVHDSLGRTVGDAKVAVDSGEPNWQRQVSSGPPIPEATSGADGTFVLGDLRAGKVALVATSPDFAASVPVNVELAPAQKAEGVVLVLRDGGSLTGEVYVDGGAPGTGMMVQVTEMTRFDQQMSFADGKGKFAFEHLVPGSWQVVALPTGGGSGSEDGGEADAVMSMVSKMKTSIVTIVDGEVTHVVLGAPPADPVRVHGRVTHAGEAYGGALVSFIPDGKGVLSGMKMAQVGKDGAYSVVLDEPGDYSASVQKMTGGMGQQNTVEFTCEIPKDSKEHELDFAMPTARISGRVKGTDGEYLAGTRVSLTPQTAIEVGTIWGGQYTELATDAEGRFDIPALRPGTYTLIVGGTSFGGFLGEGSGGGTGRDVRPGLKLSEGEWMRDVDFRLKRPGSARITVVDEGGAPVADAAIFARTQAGDLLDRFSFIATESSGQRVYGGLSPGSYTFSARKELATSTESHRVTIEEGAQAEVKLVLQSGTILLVSVTGEEDKPLKANLSVQDDQGREVGAMVALSEIMKMFGDGGGISSKEQRVGPVPPGKYKVKATLSDGRTSTKMVTLNGQPERKLTIRL